MAVSMEFLSPRDAIKGSRRLYDILEECFAKPDYGELYLAVAFAKSGPFLRLESVIEKWRSAGGEVKAVFGIDAGGTSREALELALTLFDETYVAFNPVVNCTFHPKMYLFHGPSNAKVIVGSHNFTVGGLETNLEAGVCVDLALPSDDSIWQQAYRCWEELLPPACIHTRRLDNALLSQLVGAGLVASELAQGAGRARQTTAAGRAARGLFPPVPPKAPRGLPRPGRTGRKAKKKRKPAAPALVPPGAPLPVQAFVIQIIPHHNGEIFLSKQALDENPRFFAYPFTGRTIPKKPANPSYPQRDPDPTARLSFYDRNLNLVVDVAIPTLNMVYYTRKHDIRITVKPSLAKRIPPYSMLVMRDARPAGYDYQLDVYAPGSANYDSYLAQCTTTLPSGGKPQPRKMGWL